jgi:hypothetical protein
VGGDVLGVAIEEGEELAAQLAVDAGVEEGDIGGEGHAEYFGRSGWRLDSLAV